MRERGPWNGGVPGHVAFRRRLALSCERARLRRTDGASRTRGPREGNIRTDIEWDRDGEDGKLHVLQAQATIAKASERMDALRRLRQCSEVLATGCAIGQRIASGPVRVVSDPSDMDRVREGDVLVTDTAGADWEPAMKRAAAIVTNRGGRTCDVAIIARELGIPAVVGCGDATRVLAEGRRVTVSCAEGPTGFVYGGVIET